MHVQRKGTISESDARRRDQTLKGNRRGKKGKSHDQTPGKAHQIRQPPRPSAIDQLPSLSGTQRRGDSQRGKAFPHGRSLVCVQMRKVVRDAPRRTHVSADYCNRSVNEQKRPDGRIKMLCKFRKVRVAAGNAAQAGRCQRTKSQSQ